MSNRLPLLLSLVGVFVVENHCGRTPLDHQRLALHFLERGLYERALTEAHRARREDSSNSVARMVAALAHLGLQNVERAVAELAVAIRLDPDNPRLYATLREICLKEARLDLARDMLEGLFADLPDNWHVRAGLAWAYQGLNADESALRLLEGAVDPQEDLDGDVRRFALVQLGRIYQRQNRPDEAVAVLEEALLDNPDDIFLLLLLGECHLIRGDEALADQRFDAAVRGSGDMTSTATQVAQLYYNTGRRQRAILYYERALEGEASALVLNNLAWAYAEEGGTRIEKAIELSLRAVKSEADNVVYLDTYAELLYLQQRYQHAVALMRRALELEPEGGQHRVYLQGQLEKFRTAAGATAVPGAGRL